MRVIAPKDAASTGLWRELTKPFPTLSAAEAWIDGNEGSDLTVTLREDKGGYVVDQLVCAWEEPWTDDEAYVGR